MKTSLRYMLALCTLFFSSGNLSFAQCQWQNGEMLTYSQGDYGDAANPASTFLINNYSTVYLSTLGTLRVGIGWSISFNAAFRVIAYLPASGPSSALVGNVGNPTSTSAGVFGGETVALHINVDFSDAGLLGSGDKFGDLVVYGLAETNLNGLTIRQVLNQAERALGTSSSLYPPGVMSLVISNINTAFLNGVPSPFAQDHLLKPNCIPPNCQWQQGDMLTYNQNFYGAASSAGAQLMGNNFNGIYPGHLFVGGRFFLEFNMSAAVVDFLPAGEPVGVLTGSESNPISSSAGSLGGQVVALKINVDFSAAGLLPSAVPLGDLILTNTLIPAVNGMTVSEFLALANAVLGGGNTTVDPNDVDYIAGQINNAFPNGTPSQFAQNNLVNPNCNPTPSCEWQAGDFITYTQARFNSAVVGDPTEIFTSTNYNAVFASTFGAVEVGIPGATGYSMRFGNTLAIQNYLVAGGSPADLIADLINPTSSSSGIYGGNVLALTLVIAFSDAGFMVGSVDLPFGDLVLYNMEGVLSSLNGLTVRQINNIANTLLGGVSNGYTIDDINQVVLQLSAAFAGSLHEPSQFAIDHLRNPNCNPCPTSTVWQAGEMTTYPQGLWGDPVSTAGNLLNSSWDALYPLGFTVGGQYTMRFHSAATLDLYLPSAGGNAILGSNYTDPDETNSGGLGGQVVALKLNVDFSDHGYINNSINFGDLVIHNYSLVPEVNGLTVREFLDLANNILGGNAGAIIDADIASFVASELNSSFTNGSPSSFSLNNLVIPCEISPANHCPIATSSNVTTPIESTIIIQLQASDEDNDAITYTISQNPSHGTVTVSATGLATYTAAAGYYGTDQFKFKASDGICDAEATVTVTIVVCPKSHGYWKNNQNAWPVSSLLLGSRTYTKAQLVKILKTAVGTGSKADASIILAYQLIAAKLNIAKGSPTSASLNDSIATADALIGANLIPMKIKPSSVLGKKMTSLASFLERYNTGFLTTGCTVPPALVKSPISEEEDFQTMPPGFVLEQNQPNPFNSLTTIRYALPALENGNRSYHVTLKMYDGAGREIKTMSDRVDDAGWKTVSFDAGNLAAGVYYYRLQAGKFSEVKKMVIVK